jgi:tight adherence protein B
VRRGAIVVALAILALGASVAGAAPQPLRISQLDTSRLPLVGVTVQAPTALAAKGTPAFTVSENGRPVSGVTVSDPNKGAEIQIVLDGSRSMIGKPIARAITAARAFAAAKKPIDDLSVLSFGKEVSAATPFTNDPTSVDAALREVSISPDPGTALYDALLDGMRSLDESGSGRRVLIVLTDGDDTSSKATKAQVIAAAHEADVVVYAIALKSPTFKPLALKSITEATGGALFQANTTQIKSVYAEIGRDLHSTYLLQYTSSLPAKQITLQVAAPGTTPATERFAARSALTVAPPKLISQVSAFSSNPFASLMLALAVGAAVLLSVLLFTRPSSARRLGKRIEGYAQISEKRVERAGGPRKSLFANLVTATERIGSSLKYWQRATFLLQQADLPLRAAELFYIQLGLGALLGIISHLIPVIAWYESLAAFAIGAVLPHMYVKRKAGKRLKKFEAQLPDTLVATAASLRAGHSFAQALATIVKDGGEPAAKEFGRVEAETRLGRSTDDALQAMATRLASRNFEFVVLAVNIQRQVGGSLAEILDMVADTVREREQFSRKVKALTAMGRASAYVLVGMPFFIGLALAAINASYVAPLFTTGAGNVMLLVGLVLIGVGTMVLRKMVNFRY